MSALLGTVLERPLTPESPASFLVPAPSPNLLEGFCSFFSFCLLLTALRRAHIHTYNTYTHTHTTCKHTMAPMIQGLCCTVTWGSSPSFILTLTRSPGPALVTP